MNTTPTKTAPCGCTFRGRVYDTANCSVGAVVNFAWTGHQRMRHAMRVKKEAV